MILFFILRNQKIAIYYILLSVFEKKLSQNRKYSKVYFDNKRFLQAYGYLL